MSGQGLPLLAHPNKGGDGCDACEALGEPTHETCRQERRPDGTMTWCWRIKSSTQAAQLPNGFRYGGPLKGGMGSIIFGGGRPDHWSGNKFDNAPKKSSGTRAEDLRLLQGSDAEVFVAYKVQVFESLALEYRTDVQSAIEAKGARYLPSEYVPVPSPSERHQAADYIAQAHKEGGPLAALQEHDARDLAKRVLWLPKAARWIELHRSPAGVPRHARVSLVDSADKARQIVGVQRRAHYPLEWRRHATNTGTLVLTEGARKANETQWRTGFGAIGLSTVHFDDVDFDELVAQLPALAKDGLLEILLAPDWADMSDALSNHDTTRISAIKWARIVDVAESYGIEVLGLTWLANAQRKGLDDLLQDLGHEGPGLPPEARKLPIPQWFSAFNWHSHVVRDDTERGVRELSREQVREPLRFFPEDVQTVTLEEARNTLPARLEAVLDAARKGGPGQVHFLTDPPGTGKSWALKHLLLAMQAARQTGDGPREPMPAVFVAPAVIDELERELKAEGLNVYRRVGLTHKTLGCEWGERFAEADYLSNTRSLCHGCQIPLERPCHARRLEKQDLEALDHQGSIILADAGSYDSLAGNGSDTNALAGRLVIFDDCAATTRTSEEFDLINLRSLSHPSRGGGSKAWGARMRHVEAIASGAVALANTARTKLDEASRGNSGAASEAQRYGIDLDAEETAAFLGQFARDLDSRSIEDALRVIVNLEPAVDPRPSPKAVRDQPGVRNPLKDTERVVLGALLQALTLDPAEKEDLRATFGRPRLHVSSDGGLKLSAARPRPLGIHAEAGTVVLDSSAHALRSLFAKANPGTELHFHGVRVEIGDDRPVHAVHAQRAGFHRAGLLVDGTLTPKGRTRIAQVILEAHSTLPAAHQTIEFPKLAVLADKPVAVGLRDELNAEHPETLGTSAFDLQKFDVNEERILHRGLGDRAVNIAADADVLVILGLGCAAPRAYALEAEALGLTIGEVKEARQQEALWQAIGRLRPLQRTTPAALLFAGGGSPPPALVAWGLPTSLVEATRSKAQTEREERFVMTRILAAEIHSRFECVTAAAVEAVWRTLASKTQPDTKAATDYGLLAKTPLTGSREPTYPSYMYMGDTEVSRWAGSKPPHRDTLTRFLKVLVDAQDDPLLGAHQQAQLRVPRGTGTIDAAVRVFTKESTSGTDATERGQRLADAMPVLRAGDLSAFYAVEPFTPAAPQVPDIAPTFEPEPAIEEAVASAPRTVPADLTDPLPSYYIPRPNEVPLPEPEVHEPFTWADLEHTRPREPKPIDVPVEPEALPEIGWIAQEELLAEPVPAPEPEPVASRATYRLADVPADKVAHPSFTKLLEPDELEVAFIRSTPPVHERSTRRRARRRVAAQPLQIDVSGSRLEEARDPSMRSKLHRHFTEWYLPIIRLNEDRSELDRAVRDRFGMTLLPRLPEHEIWPGEEQAARRQRAFAACFHDGLRRECDKRDRLYGKAWRGPHRLRVGNPCKDLDSLLVALSEAFGDPDPGGDQARVLQALAPLLEKEWHSPTPRRTFAWALGGAVAAGFGFDPIEDQETPPDSPFTSPKTKRHEGDTRCAESARIAG